MAFKRSCVTLSFLIFFILFVFAKTLEKLIAHLTSYISSSCYRKFGSIDGESSKLGEFNLTVPKLFGRQEL